MHTFRIQPTFNNIQPEIARISRVLCQHTARTLLVLVSNNEQDLDHRSTRIHPAISKHSVSIWTAFCWFPVSTGQHLASSQQVFNQHCASTQLPLARAHSTSYRHRQTSADTEVHPCLHNVSLQPASCWLSIDIYPAMTTIQPEVSDTQPTFIQHSASTQPAFSRQSTNFKQSLLTFSQNLTIFRQHQLAFSQHTSNVQPTKANIHAESNKNGII